MVFVNDLRKLVLLSINNSIYNSERFVLKAIMERPPFLGIWKTNRVNSKTQFLS